MTEAEDKLVQAHSDMSELLRVAQSHFVKGVKLSLLIRHPDGADRSMIVTNDTLADVIRTIQELQGMGDKEAWQLTKSR